MHWRADITDIEGSMHTFLSALPIKIHFYEENDFVLFRGEHDTIGMPIEKMAHFRIYEIGSYASPVGVTAA